MLTSGLARGLATALEEAGADEPMQLACRLGFAGAVARLTGQPDPRPAGEIAFTRLLAVERTATARGLSTALRAAAVRHCFVKAAALDACYRPGERDADDVDLLVARDDMRSCLDVLAAQGYTPGPDAYAAAPESMRRGIECRGQGVLAPTLDLQWGLTAVNRLLSDCDAAVLLPLWNEVLVHDHVAVPPPTWHVALLLHHLVHHDLLHARAVLDLLLVTEQLAPGDDARVREVATRLRVRRVAEAWLVAAARMAGRPSPPWTVAGRLVAALDPARLFALGDQAPVEDHVVITPRRLQRRWRLLDRRRDAWRLVRDAVLPPDAYLRWRWPDAHGRTSRWLRHARRTLGKLILRRD